MIVGVVGVGFMEGIVQTVEQRMFNNNQSARIGQNGELIVSDSGVFWFGEWISVHNVVAEYFGLMGKQGSFNIQVVYLLANEGEDSYVGTVYGKPLLGINVLCMN
jgi:hypothetical protein